MKILLSYKSLAIVLISTITLLSCTKKEDKDFNPSRYFTPGKISTSNGELTASLKWDPSLYLQSPAGYEIEVALDSSFNPVVKQLVADTAGIILTTDDITIKTTYYARVRAKASGSVQASHWEISGSFRITGEQLFNNIVDTDIKDVRATLRFRPEQQLTHIRIINAATLAQEDFQLTPEEIEEGIKTIEGLSPLTVYNALLFNNTLERGSTTFTTKELSLFTYEVTPEDDFLTIIANAASGEVIGFHPGVYDFGTESMVFLKKHVVLASVSGDPADTKLIYKEFTLRGDGAGITIRGVTIDQLNTGGSYVVNLVGESAANAAATFSSVTIENSILEHIGRAIVRGSQGAAVSTHKIDFIRIENVWVRNSNNDYALLEIQKLEVNNVTIRNSTFSGFNQNLIRYDNNMGTFAPNVVLSKVTINGFGSANRRVLVDFNSPVNFTLENSIIANTPRGGAAINNDLYRLGTGAQTFSQVFGYNLMRADGTTPLNTPGQTFAPATLTWTETTNDFTLPAGSPLRTAATDGGAVGDPRWAL
jgi:hypothetical protein